LYENLGKKIAGLIDVGYTDEQGIKELINKSGEVLTDLEIMKEKKLMQQFLSELVKRGGLATYGEKEIRKCLQLGAVDTLIISENLRRGQVTVRCGGCGHEFKEVTEDVPLYEKQLTNRSCPSCGEKKLSLVESKDLVQELCDLADQSKARVEFVSSETEEGMELLKAFKGLAALLRFRVPR
jgi:peptide chain release factor subunit 1